MKTRAVKAILGLIGDAEHGGSLAAYHAELLAGLAGVFGCDVLVFNEFRISLRAGVPGGATVSCAPSPPLEPRGAVSDALLGAFARNMSQHPLIWLHAAGDRGSRRLSDATSMRGFRRCALYGDFFRPAGIAHQLTLGLDGPPADLVGVWFNRARRDFSEEDLVLAELLRPRLRAAEIAMRRAGARAALTAREREVLDIVAGGATNAAVAEVLVVSPATVKKHLDNIYGKLGVGSRAAAADRACTHPGGG